MKTKFLGYQFSKEAILSDIGQPQTTFEHKNFLRIHVWMILAQNIAILSSEREQQTLKKQRIMTDKGFSFSSFNHIGQNLV